MAKTLYDKVWDAHEVSQDADGVSLIYVDRHLLHEVSTHQSFVQLEESGRRVHRPDSNLAVADHAVPTVGRGVPIPPGLAHDQVERLEENAARFGVPYIPLTDARQGIVHVIGPEQGFTLPGSVLVCGDSHTSTHGALGALAFGIGASECGIVLATQCLRQRRSKTAKVEFTGRLHPRLSAKDMALAFIAHVGADGGVGYALEYAGEAVRALDMAGRMTLCNLSIEAGARVGLIAPDDETFAYLAGRPMAPKGAMWERALDDWRTLPSDAGAVFHHYVTLDASAIAPHVTWGTSPQDAAPIHGRVPDPARFADPQVQRRAADALAYMGLKGGQALEDVAIDHVFIGSCTNGRLEDLRAAADVIQGRRVSPRVTALVVPGSTGVKRQAEAEGLDRIFTEAGFQWRESGCSMCVAINGDMVGPGERCASTSNRNFEGRQGPGARTHLMSPAMAAAAALAGCLVDVRHYAS